MSTIVSALRSEITRIARKEARANTEELKRTLSSTRSEIKILKERVQALEKQDTARSPKSQPSPAMPDSPLPAAVPLRFRPAWLVALRKRLGLTQSELAKVIGVSPLSVYNWESGRIRPRDSFIQAIANVRSLSRQELAARLAATPTSDGH